MKEQEELFLEHCEKGDLAKVAEMLKNNSALSFAENQVGCTPLQLAAINGKLALLELLISANSVNRYCVDFQNKCGFTALHYAALFNHENIVTSLLQVLPTVETQDMKGRTPLHYAAWNGNIPIITALVRRGAKIDAEDKSGITPLDCVLLSQKKDATEYFTELLWKKIESSSSPNRERGVFYL